MSTKPKGPSQVIQHIWLKGRTAEVLVQPDELEILKKVKKGIVVCNRFNAKYEDVIVSNIIKQVNENYKLITTREKSAAFLEDAKIICVKTSALNTWAKRKKAIIEALNKVAQNGELAVVFPSRRLNQYNLDRLVWDKDIIEAIVRLQLPVVPLFLQRKGSSNMGYLEKISEYSSGFLGRKVLEFEMRVGKPVLPEEIAKFTDIKQFRRFLFTKTYALGSPLEVDRFYHVPAEKRQNAIDPRVDTKLLRDEISTLDSFKAAERGSLQAYICPMRFIPEVMKEIGVLREITYREAGEGTGKRTDIDEYDLYYRQLFIWDKKEERIVGGYRLGCGNDIMIAYGRGGLYINSLFKLDKELDALLKESLELGRSFIIKDYQKDPFPLFVLWKAIFAFLKDNKQFRYLIGPVSLSADYSQFSRELIVAFLKENYFDHNLSQYVHARNPFVETISFRKKSVLLSQFKGILGNLDKFIEEIEPRHFKLPVLIKQYLKQNSRFIGFNVDPEFANAIDCLIVLDAKNLPNSTIENLN